VKWGDSRVLRSSGPAVVLRVEAHQTVLLLGMVSKLPAAESKSEVRVMYSFFQAVSSHSVFLCVSQALFKPGVSLSSRTVSGLLNRSYNDSEYYIYFRVRIVSSSDGSFRIV
jgi:hypothetical protein